MQVLAFPNVSYKDLFKLEPKLIKIDEETLKQIQKDATYVNYLDRQRKDIDTIKKDERVLIPMDLDYNSIQGLSTELKVKCLGHVQRTCFKLPTSMGLLPQP